MNSSSAELRALELARSLVRAEAALLQEVEPLVDERMLSVARLINAHAGKVLPTGVGTSGEIARRMAHLLSVAGTPALFIHPTEGLHGRLGAVEGKDVVIAISKGGRSSELNEFARRAKARGAAVVALTSSPQSELGLLADIAVPVPATDTADPAGVIAMGSTLAVAAWGDALAMILKELRGYGWDQVLATHPGGAVGIRARRELEERGGQDPGPDGAGPGGNPGESAG